MYLNQYIAASGYCSRRAATEAIKNKLVLVNDKIEIKPYYKIEINDIIKINNITLKLEPYYYFLFNKPKGIICSSSKKENQKIISDFFTSIKARLFTIGRLDKDTTGLIIVTNDGKLAQNLSHPKFEIEKIYQVKVDKNIDASTFKILLNGIKLYDGIMKIDSINYSQNKKNTVFVKIHSGKNRIIRRCFEALNFKILSLDRINYAGLTKKNLLLGAYRKLTLSELKKLKTNY